MKEGEKVENYQIIMTIVSFAVMMLLIFWRPKGLNETIFATSGAAIIITIGVVTMEDLVEIAMKVGGASLTIVATFMMALVLESVGFFHWIALFLVEKAKYSGVRLFFYTNALCFFMTLFFNNDGSIIITTPILLLLLNRLRLKKHEKFPYLISGALIATASSAPIGVSNMVNLISLKMIEMDLYKQTAMMFVPTTLGLLFLFGSLFLLFYKKIPKKLPPLNHTLHLKHPLDHPLKSNTYVNIPRKSILFILIFIFIVRISLFITSYIGFPIEFVAMASSLFLIGWRWYVFKIRPYDVLVKAPWHILVFAFSMYVVVYGLNRIGLTDHLSNILGIYVGSNSLHSSLAMGSVLSVLSNVLNNHPALMIGTLTLTQIHLPSQILEISYLASIIGSDIGSLLLPIGTLATLLWMHILDKHKYKMTWMEYVKVTFIVIPPTVIVTLTMLHYWILFMF